jgi:hypothetical protein
MIDGILQVYATSPTVTPYAGTGYGLLNALTEYMDHIKPQRTGNARFESITFGEGARYRGELMAKLN